MGTSAKPPGPDCATAGPDGIAVSDTTTAMAAITAMDRRTGTCFTRGTPPGPRAGAEATT